MTVVHADTSDEIATESEADGMTPVEIHAQGPATPRRGVPLPPWAYAAAALAVFAAWAAAVWASAHVSADAPLHQAALFAHLASLVLGFGCVLALDCAALRWLLRRQTLDQLSLLAGALQLPIWAGLAGLVGSGVFLGADPTRPLTLLKLVLVLAVALNGIFTLSVHQRLDHRQGPLVQRPLLVRAVVSAFVSQAGWWGAMLIGFLNTQSS